MKQQLDLRGLSCPVPQMRALDAIHARKAPLLIIHADYGGGAESVMRTAKSLALECSSKRIEDYCEIIIRLG